MFSKDNLRKLVYLFMLTFPIFELEIFYNSFTTIIRMFIIVFCFIWLLIIDKKARKYIKHLVIFYMILLIYALFHHLNALNFTSLVPDNFNYSWLKEVLYLFKMSIPLLFFYILSFVKLNKKEYITTIKFWILFICGSIILTNVFQLSLGSYSDSIIKGSIFNWFNTSLTYYDLASKGLFMYANQISCLLVILLSITYYLFVNNKIKGYYLILIMITLLMLGTRVSNIGGFILFFILLFLYIIFGLLKHYKIDKNKIIYSVLILICFLLILPFSPTLSRYKMYNYILTSEVKLSSENLDKLKYIEANYEGKEIYKLFILERYPYTYDPDFWLNILNQDYAHRTNYRFLEESMINRVIEINNNKYDSLLGITNVRVQNIFNVERDYVLQYYAYGIIGSIILLGVYFLIFIKNLIKLIKKFCLKNSIILLVTLLFLAISYLSGNILSQLSVPLMFMFLNGVLNEED